MPSIIWVACLERVLHHVDEDPQEQDRVAVHASPGRQRTDDEPLALRGRVVLEDDGQLGGEVGRIHGGERDRKLAALRLEEGTLRQDFFFQALGECGDFSCGGLRFRRLEHLRPAGDPAERVQEVVKKDLLQYVAPFQRADVLEHGHGNGRAANMDGCCPDLEVDRLELVVPVPASFLNSTEFP